MLHNYTARSSTSANWTYDREIQAAIFTAPVKPRSFSHEKKPTEDEHSLYLQRKNYEIIKRCGHHLQSTLHLQRCSDPSVLSMLQSCFERTLLWKRSTLHEFQPEHVPLFRSGVLSTSSSFAERMRRRKGGGQVSTEDAEREQCCCWSRIPLFCYMPTSQK